MNRFTEIPWKLLLHLLKIFCLFIVHQTEDTHTQFFILDMEMCIYIKDKQDWQDRTRQTGLTGPEQYVFL